MSTLPVVSWGLNGQVSLGPISAASGPYDNAAVAPVWASVAGFSGTPTVSASEARICGNIESGTFRVTGLTAASGDCIATFTLPRAVSGGTFTRSEQGGAEVFALIASGQSLMGRAVVSPGAGTMAVSLTNNSETPVALAEIHVNYLYCLV